MFNRISSKVAFAISKIIVENKPGNCTRLRLKFDEDFGKEVHYVKVEADSAEHAESIKAQLKELGFICQVKSITK